MKARKRTPFIFRKKFQDIFLIVFFLFSAALFVMAFQGGDSFEIFKASVQENILYGMFVFVFLEMISIVIAPVTTIFLIPVAAEIFGPLLTSFLSIIGWTIGSSVAFLIARRFGRPFLEKIIEQKKLEKYRNYISVDQEFMTVIFLRILLPVDVLSYAIGLFTVMRFKKYLIATIIGVAPFSFIYSYGGEALLEKNYTELIYIAGFSVLVLLVGYVFFRKIRKKK